MEKGGTLEAHRKNGMSGGETPFDNGIAILGMAGRFPQAPDLKRFWENLRGGVESIASFSDSELLAAGVGEAALRDPAYVRAGGVLDGVDLFDAPFFGMSAREAALLDPQQRLFLEHAWEALEAAGYDSQRIQGSVGVYAGASTNSYYLYYLFSPRDLLSSPEGARLFLGSDKDFLATRTSYKLGLRGPSLSVQTACSTSLVAVHLACQSLLSGECDMALAGGVSVRVPQRVGYFHQPGGILSPDGHCRTFDAEAGGSVIGSGVGVVVLKRLEDALADGDPVRAVIRGSAVNNDGALRVGYTAPSVEGQAAAIAEALALARVEPETVTYVEAHGSGTPLGDPIEMAALARALGGADPRERRGFCAVGSVKTNIGHLDAAAGVAGLIKTVLALEHRELPPSLHFRSPNPDIDFAGGPCHVNTELREWTTDGGPRRAGVSSFGMGGTNAHVVLEEAPETEPSESSRPWQLLVLSAASGPALERATDNLVRHLEEHPEEPLPDIAWTLQAGRRVFSHRRALVCRDAAAARQALAARDPARLLESVGERTDRPVAFLFPGMGDEYVGMARGLYKSEPVFREELDRCFEILEPLLERDLRGVLYLEDGGPDSGQAGPAGPDLRALLGRSGSPASELSRVSLAQPALFAVEYALARLWMAWGIAPRAMLGYSLGEYVAACLAGVMPLADALRVVALRARLLEDLPAGAMLAVPLPEDEARALAGEELSLSAVNGPGVSILAGPAAAVAAVEERLAANGVVCRRLQTSHAFHSAMMRPLAEPLARLMAGIPLRAPEIPYLSNVTGSWITAEQATDPDYWVRHLLEPVRFGDGLAELWREAGQVLLEVGPGRSLSSLALQHPEAEGGRVAVSSLRPAHERRPDEAFLLAALGRLWLAGVPVDWQGFRGDERRRRLRLPTYPFERRRYWVEDRASDVEERDASPVATTVHARPGLATPYVAPAGPAEEVLAGLWRELLGVAQVGAHDNFFELGGHSLLAAQLVARITARFGVELPLSALFEAPTVAALAPRLGQAAPEAPPLPSRPSADRAPLSFAQQRLWFIDRLAPGISAYNNPVAVRLTGPLSVPALAASLSEIVRRHEILRTTFPVEGGEPVQRIQVFDPAAIPPLPVFDLRHAGHAGDTGEAEARDLMSRLTRQPFDLGHHAALRFALLRLGPDEHLFLTVMHHILWDEWSQGIFVGELAVLYEAFRDGLPPSLPELPLQYGDYALWQRELLRGGALEDHLAYWRERLAGAPRLLALPTDRPRPAAQTFRGGSRQVALSPELHRGLAALSQAHGATLFMTLLAAFQTLLSRYTGQEDLIVSTGTGGRGRVEAERLIGCFINILLLRGDLTGGPAFTELLARTRRSTLEAYARDLPFELVVDALRVDRDPSTTPLTQAMLVLLNVPPVAITLRGLEIEGLRVDRAAAQLDLTLYLGEQGGSLGGHLEYNTDLFDAATIDRLLGHFRVLLEGIAADPDRAVEDLPLLTEAERRQAVVEWNRTAEAFPSGSCLHELFEAQVERRPEAAALVFGDEPFSYREVNRRANRLAHRLRGLGVRRGTPVGISLRHSPEVVAGMLGILKAGGAYVPLDPNYPDERLASMVESARVETLLTEGSLAERFAGLGVRTVLVDSLEQAPEEVPVPEDNPESGATPEDLVYVIFTSGSTGRPKGCALDHRGRVNNFTDFNRRFGIGEGDRVLALSSLSFDMSAYDVLGTLAGGATIVLPRPEEVLEPAAWARLIVRHRVTVWHSVPALLEMLVDHVAPRPESHPASIRLVLLGGDWIPVPLPDRFRSLVPEAQVVSLGGATEVSMDSIVHPIGEVDPGWKSIPYGRPMANQIAYVVGPGPEPAPVGVPGELLLGGVGVGWGYFSRPDLTAERFIPDFLPDFLEAEPGGRVYRTGDLARYRPDGVIELLGRMDHQVKIRGFRIELGEIAAALRQYPGIGEVVVLARGDAPGEKRIVAYLVPEARGELSVPDLQEALRQTLPAYMLPSAFVVLDALPLTPNGKLDRKALPAPEPPRAGLAFVAPRTALEEVIARVWRDVLRREQVGVHDNFFDLGGHSLAATRVTARLEETLPLDIPLRTFFEAPTVESLARGLETLADHAGIEIGPMAEILVEVGELSPEDIQALLAEEAV